MQRIIVKNFGPIQEADVALNKLVIFIGEPASGKSTLAKLIYFFKSLKDDVKDFIQYGAEPITQISQSIQDKFALYFGSSHSFADDFEIKFFFSSDKFIKLYRNGSLQVGIEPIFFEQLIQKLNPLVSVIRKNGLSSDNIIFQTLDDSLDTLFEYDKEVQFIPDMRKITTSFPFSVRLQIVKELGKMGADKRQMQAKIDLFLLQDFESIVDRIVAAFVSRGGSFEAVAKSVDKNLPLAYSLELIEKILKAKYEIRNGAEILVLPKGNTTILLNNASSGQQAVIRLLQSFFLSIVTEEARFSVLEEPEIHLSPQTQSYLINLIVELLNSTRSEMLITTHSDHILNGTLVSIKKHFEGELGGIASENVKVYYFERDEDSQNHKIVDVKIQENGRIKHAPAGFFDQIGKDLRILMSSSKPKNG